jgi:hypothetical protein
MATTKSTKKPIGKTVFYGLVTAALYAAVFSQADAIMQLFTKGGMYAALPIGTVFVFSFAHGSFTGNLWSVLGVEAVVKKDQAEKRPQPAVRPTQRPRPRLRAGM